MDDLKPCPFCGGRATFVTSKWMDGQCSFKIIDGYLGIETTEDEVVAIWNRRVDNDLALSNA